MSYWVQKEDGKIVNFHVAIEGKERSGWETVDDIPDELKNPPEPETLDDKIKRIVREEIEKEKVKPKP